MESKWQTEKDYLELAILVEGKSYEELGREYGCSGSNIKKVAQRIGIELPKRRKINPNCYSLLDTYKSKNKNSDREYRYTKEGGQDG